MIKCISPFKTLFLLSAAILLFSCSDDGGSTPTPPDPDPQPTGSTKVFQLASASNLGVSGTATFIEIDDGSTTIELDLQNTTAGGDHPAHIYANTAVEGGDLLLTLGNVNGSDGKSTINVSALDDGSAISYAQLLDINGHIEVALDDTDLVSLIAEGDIGQNELTGQSITFPLEEADVAGVSGNAVFFERVNGTTLLTITLTGTTAGNMHPSHIHSGNVGSGGPVIVGLEAVRGDTGISMTQISELVGGAPVSYSDFATIEAYINVHNSDTDLGTIVATGNIGSSTGNANTVSYAVTNQGASAYIFNGNGLTDADNPDFTLERGKTYEFEVNAPGHPFLIKTVQGTGTGNQYTDGVTNAGAVNGTVSFTVPMDAPDTLFYICEFHGSMTGKFTITG